MNNNRSQSEKINSFRKRTLNPSEDKVTIKKVDSKTNMVFDNEDNFIMALKGKRSGRSKQEIQDFMKKKQSQEKEEAIKIDQIKKKKNLQKYYELTKLLEETQKSFFRKKKNKKGNNLNIIKNEYYVGQRNKRRLSNASNLSDSTIIDKDEFLLNILDSKKIINSGFRYDDNDNDNIINKDDYEQISNEEISKIKKRKLKETTQETKEKINKIKKDLLSSSDSFKEQIKIAKKTVKESEDLIKEKNLNQYLKPNQNKIEYSKSKEELRESINKSKHTKTTESQYEEEENKDYMINNEVPSIQVPSTIQPSNINTFNALSRENKDINNIDDKDNSIKTSDYQFDDEALEAYFEIFNGLNEFLKSIIRRNCLNDIFEYSNIKSRYKFGFEQLIMLFKYKYFNTIRFYEHYLIYYDNLRKIVLPYIKRAFGNIVYYDYSKQRLTFFNKIIEQVLKSFFYRKLFNYNKEKNNNIIPDNNKKLNKNEQQRKIIEEKKAKQKINDIDIEKNLKRLINIFQNPIRMYCLEKIFNFAYKNDTSNNKSQEDFSKIKDRRRNLSNPHSEYSNSFLSQKNNTYMYESFDDNNNSIILHPNSEDSDRLHRIYQLIEAQQEGKSNISQSEQMDISNLSNQTGKSNKSIKSLNDITKMKPGIKIGSITSLKQKQNEVNDKKNDSYEIKNLSPIPKKDNINYIKKYNENKNDENDRNNKNNLNKRNNNSSGKNILSEQDISADKEVNDIDWEYNINDKSNEKDKNKNKKIVDKIIPDELPLKKDFKDEKKDNKINEHINDSNKKEQKENSYSDDFNMNISVDDYDKDENILNVIKNEDKSIDHSK